MEKMKIKDQFEFRYILANETEEAIAIEQICFPQHEACSAKSMTERIQAAPDFFLVAMDKETGKMAGFLNGVCTDETVFRDEFFTDISLYDPKGHTVMLLGLDVLPAYRRKGLATALMSEYIKRAVQKDMAMLLLTCLEEKVKMYQKMGYQDLGIAGSTWGGEEWHEMGFKL